MQDGETLLLKEYSNSGISNRYTASVRHGRISIGFLVLRMIRRHVENYKMQLYNGFKTTKTAKLWYMTKMKGGAAFGLVSFFFSFSLHF